MVFVGVKNIFISFIDSLIYTFIGFLCYYVWNLSNRKYNQYGCNDGNGMLLEDQDGTLIASHWERKVAGN